MSSLPPFDPTESMSPEAALARLREGNRRFAVGQENAMRHWRPDLADGQKPFAIVLGCADSRAPAEYVFDQGLGDLFVIRVAGNIVAPSLVGSIEFAVRSFGTRLVVVMGHTQCGAIAATVDALDAQAGQSESRNLQSIVDRVAPHIVDVCGPNGPPDRDTRLVAATHANAVASAREIQSSSPILIDHVSAGHVMIVASVFNVATGVVQFFDPASRMMLKTLSPDVQNIAS